MTKKMISRIYQARMVTLILLGLFASTYSFSSSLGKTWDLNDLYPDLVNWHKARNDVSEQFVELARCRGQLAVEASVLAKCLKLNSATYKNLMRIYSFSFLAKDTDLGNSEWRERHSLAENLLTTYAETISFLEPELLAIDEYKLRLWQKDTSALDDYDFLIRNTLRRKSHILPAREEQILAAAGTPLRVASSTYSILANADISRPEITLSNGELAKMNPSGYTKFRGVQNRADRKAVFDNFFATYSQYQQTFAQTLTGQVQAHIFEARMRGYSSALQQALSTDNIPEQVYRTLISTVNNNLETLHRYLNLRTTTMNILAPQYYDVYPAIADLDKQYSIDDAHQLLKTALAPLGEGYQQIYQDSIARRWMHVEPSVGKRSGAYSMGAAYDVHPYILLNYNNDFDSVSTYAHEWGHAMHSVLANKAQPFSKADYPTFIAEIASISHELLLYKQLTETANTPEEKLYYLFQELQGLRGTFFRQTQFAEFELAIHEEIESGKALSADKLNSLYGTILKRYYGHDNSVMHIDDAYTVEWAYIPHFYRNFYVFQYATSISAAYYLMEKIVAGGVNEREQYLSILSAGGSDYAYDILLKAGVDMTSPEVYESVIRRCNTLMDQIEAILESR
jgi:oligoendopeptidase F